MKASKKYSETVEVVRKGWKSLWEQTVENVPESDEFYGQMEMLGKVVNGLLDTVGKFPVLEEPRFYTEKMVYQLGTIILASLSLVTNAVKPSIASDFLDEILDKTSEMLDKQMAVAVGK